MKTSILFFTAQNIKGVFRSSYDLIQLKKIQNYIKKLNEFIKNNELDYMLELESEENLLCDNKFKYIICLQGTKQFLDKKFKECEIIEINTIDLDNLNIDKILNHIN